MLLSAVMRPRPFRGSCLECEDDLNSWEQSVRHWEQVAGESLSEAIRVQILLGAAHSRCGRSWRCKGTTGRTRSTPPSWRAGKQRVNGTRVLRWSATLCTRAATRAAGKVTKAANTAARANAITARTTALTRANETNARVALARRVPGLAWRRRGGPEEVLLLRTSLTHEKGLLVTPTGRSECGRAGARPSC